uniref:Carbohydrate sulfotransferase n=1 Tax=Calidris pygmaea TaxID=425635 RepID=A0A8C3KM32_9CHAR
PRPLQFALPWSSQLSHSPVRLAPLWAFLTPISKWRFTGDLVPKVEEGFTLTLDTFLHLQQLRKKRLRAFCRQSGKVTTLPRSREERAHLLSKRQLSEFNLTEIEAMLESYTKVLFVRDPFQRLISAFMQGMGSSPSFSSFVQDVLASGQHNASATWKPLVSLCRPCLVQYDYVVVFGFLRQELVDPHREPPVVFPILHAPGRPGPSFGHICSARNVPVLRPHIS